MTRPGDAKEVGQWMAAEEHAGPSRKKHNGTYLAEFSYLFSRQSVEEKLFTHRHGNRTAR